VFWHLGSPEDLTRIVLSSGREVTLKEVGLDEQQARAIK
jgi:hypothetical protein